MGKKIVSKIIASLLVLVMAIGYIPTTTVYASGMSYTPENFGLTLNQVNNSNGKVNYTMNWNPVSFKYNDDGSTPTTRYYLARRKVNPNNANDTSGEYKWELRGNYTDEGVRVLNIYPNAGDGLQSWMNNISNSSDSNGFDVNITVDKQSLSDFNKNPEAKLKKAVDGSYNYDVVVFGFWDSNNHVDISKSYTSSGTSAYKVMDDYIKSGYGVIFGHDTIQMKDNSRNPNFTSLLTENSSFTVIPRDQSGWHYSEKIAVKQQGSLTTYPFDIYGKSLIVPMTHNVNQLATDTSTVYMTFEKNYYPSGGDGPYYNYNVNGAKDTVMYDTNTKKYVKDFDVTNTTRYLPANSYLMKDDNVAFIQSGHSSGKTSTTEQMILANTIYSLKQMIKGTTTVDQVLDTAKPNAPSTSYADETMGSLKFTAEDNGSTYKYRVIAAPVGLSIYEQWDNISPLLDNPSVYDYVYPNSNGKMVAFSQIKDTGEVKAGVKTEKAFEYYIDRKANGEKRDGTFISGSGTIGLPILDNITKDTYLHIWTYDNANNVSFERTKEDGTYTFNDANGNPVTYTVYNGITNINLWDAYPKLTATVKYEDEIGNPLEDVIGNSQYQTTQMIGTVFAPSIPNINGYRFKVSAPESGRLKIEVGSDNTVTHIYDEILSKDIKVAIHNDPNPANVEVVDYKTVKGIATDKYIIDLPQSYNNYEYSGYYTLGDGTQTATSGTTYALGSELEITDDNTLYLHYKPVQKTFDVIVKDVTNNKTYATIPVTGYVGHTTVVLSSLIKNSVKDTLTYPTAYQNYKILEENLSIDVTADTGDQIIELIPRTKTILYLGYDFSGLTPTLANTTSGAAVRVGDSGFTRDGAALLGAVKYQFDGTNNTEIVPTTESGITDGWTFLRSTAHNNGSNYYIDFTNKVNTVSMTYYKGTLPSHVYNILANYYNVFGGGKMPPKGLITSNPLEINTSIDNPSLVPIEEYQDVAAFGDVPAGTDFEVDKIIVYGVATLGNKVKLGEYEATDNIYEYLPDMNSDGSLVYTDYVVDVTYRPYGDIKFNEYLCDTNDVSKFTELNAREYHKLYEDNVSLVKTPLQYPHEVAKIVIDGRILTEAEIANFDFTKVPVDKYSKTIEVYYRPLTYDLTVKARSNGSENFDIYTYNDVAYNRATSFVAPTFNGYTFMGATIDSATDETADLVVDGNNIKFLPNGVEGSYTVYLDYNQNAEVYVTYIILDYDGSGKVVEKHQTVSYTDGVYVGEEYTASPLSSEQYELIVAYTNGQVYDLEEGEEYTVTVNEPLTKAYLVYIPKNKYSVTLKANPTMGGEVSGNTTHLGDNKFYAGSKVTISATANEGYEFLNWTSGDVTLADSSILATSFIMPNKNVTITANFRRLGTDGGGDGGGDGEDIVTPVGPVVPVNPPEIVLPERPTIPGDIGNIIGLINDPVGEIIRKYEPYITGYPEGDVQPSGSITRAEVMQVVYNLYGYGLYRDSYGDKSAINTFNDVDYDNWYSDAVAFCLDYGVVNGYSDGTIRPDEPISRGELAAILAKFILTDGDYSSGLTDLDETWAKDAIEKLYANGIINGYPDGSFKPNQTTVRSEFTVMVNRLIERPEEYNKNIVFPDLPETHWAYDDMMNAANGGVIHAENAQEVLDSLQKNK